MYIVKFCARATDRYTEVSPSDLEGSAIMIEDLVSRALREVLRLVIVDRLELIYVLTEPEDEELDDLFDGEDHDIPLDYDDD